MAPESIELSATLKFVLSCLQEDDRQVRQLLSAVDWEAFFTLIDRHRIGPIVVRNLRNMDVAIPDDNTIDTLKELYRNNVARTLAHTQAIHRLANLFGTAGIEFMLLKGFSNRTGYELLADRHVNDLDILIRRESQIWQAITVLRDSGLKVDCVDPLCWSNPQKREYLLREKHFRLFDSAGRVHIELHFRLFNYSESKCLDVEKLWSEPKLLNVSGVNVLVPNNTIHLEYLVLHGCSCAWFRLKWVSDLYFMLRVQSEAELNELVNRARRGGWLRPLLLTLSIQQYYFSLPLSLKISQLIDADRVLGSLQQEVLRAIDEPTPAERIQLPLNVRGNALIRRIIYNIKLRSAVLPLWQAISGHGFSPENWRILPLPASMHFLYKGLHPVIHLYRVLISR